jgi:hypothetical protein
MNLSRRQFMYLAAGAAALPAVARSGRGALLAQSCHTTGRWVSTGRQGGCRCAHRGQSPLGAVGATGGGRKQGRPGEESQ